MDDWYNYYILVTVYHTIFGRTLGSIKRFDRLRRLRLGVVNFRLVDWDGLCATLCRFSLSFVDLLGLSDRLRNIIALYIALKDIFTIFSLHRVDANGIVTKLYPIPL